MAAPSEQQQKPHYVAVTEGFFHRLGLSATIPEAAEKKDFYSDLIRSLIRVDRIASGQIACSLTVTAAVTNPYNTLHGGVVAAAAEVVALACVKSVAGDKDFFLGESSMAYLSAARLNEEVEVEGWILRKGKSVMVISVEFKKKETGKLFYTSRATFYLMPLASL